MREVDMAWNDRSNLTTEYTEDAEVVEGLGLSYKSYRAYSKGCAFTIHYSKFIIQTQRQVILAIGARGCQKGRAAGRL